MALQCLMQERRHDKKDWQPSLREQRAALYTREGNGKARTMVTRHEVSRGCALM